MARTVVGQVALLLGVLLCCGGQQTLFLEGTNSLSTEFHGDFLAVNNKSLGLQIRLPDFLSMAL